MTHNIRWLAVLGLALLGGCATRGSVVSTQTCVGSVLLGFQQCVTVARPVVK